MTHPLVVFREKRKITRSRMARLSGCHVSYIGHIEEGRRRPSPDLAKRIEKATEGEVTAMMLLYPERPSKPSKR